MTNNRAPRTDRPRRSRSRLLGLTLPLLGLGLGLGLTTFEPPQLAALTPAQAPALALHFEPNPFVVRTITAQLGGEFAGQGALDRTPERRPALGEVYWTVPEPTSAEVLAATWGLGRDLYALNPDIGPGAHLPAGAALRVYQPDPERPTQSVGAPNRGKLINGMPIPEGEHWRLRSMRRRAYGSELTVNALVSAFNAYGERFPGAPKIRVGELAQRKGGKISPHRSHRSGRDVDLGYIALGEDDGDVRWQLMNASNLDVEKNWYLIHEMIKSGEVESIFISSRLQPLLYAEAKRHLTEEELSGLFQYPRSAPGSKDAVIRHWSGHRNHMHVRFRCEDWNSRCRATKHDAH
ncbi:MAG: penicillin-insensitive murein endopeptidase [Nannocystis sp.]|nr:penicillin-insensitive murein endopeptidase [Nannocystis sp.]